MKKIKTGTMLYPSTIKLCDNNLSKANVKSRNDFIDKAIIFYVDYLNDNKQLAYLNKALDNKIDSKINNTEYEINKIIYKLATEINIMSKILASYFDIDIKTLSTMREQSEEETSTTIGIIENCFTKKES